MKRLFLVLSLILCMCESIYAKLSDSVQITSNTLWCFGEMLICERNCMVFFVRITIENNSTQDALLIPDLVGNDLCEISEYHYAGKGYVYLYNRIDLSSKSKLIIYKIVGRPLDLGRRIDKPSPYKYICIPSANVTNGYYSYLTQPLFAKLPNFNSKRWKDSEDYRFHIKSARHFIEKREIYQLILNEELQKQRNIKMFTMDLRR